MEKVAVITPYFNEPLEFIEKANHSVINQYIPCDHIIISDGEDKNNQLKKLKCISLELPFSYNNNGNTPRSVGINLAISKGYDYIAFLDADNWFHSEHILSLVNLLKKNNSNIGCSFRTFHNEAGEIIKVDEDDDVLEHKHVDTSCYLLEKDIHHLINIWHLIPKQLSQYCDRLFYVYLRVKNFKIAFSNQYTVSFRTLYENHYKMANLELPKKTKLINNFNKDSEIYLNNPKNNKYLLEKFGFDIATFKLYTF